MFFLNYIKLLLIHNSGNYSTTEHKNYLWWFHILASIYIPTQTSSREYQNGLGNFKQTKNNSSNIFLIYVYPWNFFSQLHLRPNATSDGLQKHWYLFYSLQFTYFYQKRKIKELDLYNMKKIVFWKCMFREKVPWCSLHMFEIRSIRKL
jgi:hypothetical protein